MSIIQTSIITSVDIEDVFGFNENPQKNLKIMLNKIYKGKCYKNTFILNVKEITKQSNCTIRYDGLDAMGKVNVEFVADCVIIGKWDIIPATRIIRNDEFILGKGVKIFSNESENENKELNIMVNLIPTPQTQVLRKDQVVIARVTEINFPISSSDAICYALLLTCELQFPVFKVDEELNKEELNKLKQMSNSLELELKKRQEIFKNKDLTKSLFLIESLLHSFKGLKCEPIVMNGVDMIDLKFEEDKSDEKTTQYFGFRHEKKSDNTDTLINIVDVIMNNKNEKSKDIKYAGYWWQDLSLSRTSPILNFAKNLPKNVKNIPIKEQSYVVIQKYLHNMHQYLVATRWFTNEYKNEEKIKQAENIWTAMRMLQK